MDLSDFETGQILARYLDALPKGPHGMPYRADFDPVHVPRIWKETILIHEEAPDLFRFRFVGRDILAWSGLKLDKELARPELLGAAHASFIEVYRRAQASPAGLGFSGCLRWLDRDWVLFDQLLWPLADQADRPSWLVGVIRHKISPSPAGRTMFEYCPLLATAARALGH